MWVKVWIENNDGISGEEVDTDTLRGLGQRLVLQQSNMPRTPARVVNKKMK